MATTVNVLTQLQQQTWQKKMQKELVVRSVWEQFSNRVHSTQPIPNGRKMKVVPKSVVINVTDSFDTGTKQTTVPFLSKLKTKGVGGRQKAEGNEETPAMKYKVVHYNVQRKPIALEDESVDGDLAKFYNIGSQGTPLLTDYFVEQTDYCYHRAILEGADEWLTESEYWTGTISSAPVSVAYHPTWLVNGASSAVSYDSTYATYESSIQTALDALVATNDFDVAALDSMVFQATRRLIPLGWNFGGEEVDYVFLLSEFQIKDLQDDTASQGWSQLMREADVRGKGNRAISGILGVYRRCLLVANPRAPLWDTGGSTGAYLGYLKPWSEGNHYDSADATITRTAKTASGSGTCEIAIALGRGAVGSAKIKPLKFDEQWKDYNFNKGVCGSRAEGCERMDFDITTPTDTSILNQTSFVYCTASPATTL